MFSVLASQDINVLLLGAESDDGLLLLGNDFLPWIVLAFGAAMIVGNVLALVRPPAPRPGEDVPDEPMRPPYLRAGVMIVIGGIAAAWGLASLVA